MHREPCVESACAPAVVGCIVLQSCGQCTVCECTWIPKAAVLCRLSRVLANRRRPGTAGREGGRGAAGNREQATWAATNAETQGWVRGPIEAGASWCSSEPASARQGKRKGAGRHATGQLPSFSGGVGQARRERREADRGARSSSSWPFPGPARRLRPFPSWRLAPA